MPVTIRTAHGGFLTIQKIVIVQVSSGFIWGIPV